jgi:hypothetical protein
MPKKKTKTPTKIGIQRADPFKEVKKVGEVTKLHKRSIPKREVKIHPPGSLKWKGDTYNKCGQRKENGSVCNEYAQQYCTVCHIYVCWDHSKLHYPTK